MSRLVRLGLPAALLVALSGLAACGSTPPVSPPTGVDGLTVPTPDPEPGDFVAEVDNPLFPLGAGSSWTYRASDGGRVRLTVEGSGSVAGVPVTTLRRLSSDADGEPVGERLSAYAQDTAGNVWSFGREVLAGDGESWQVGEDGAQAGLLVPAAPRVGDGWLQQRSPALTTRVEVLEVAVVVDVLGEEGEALVTRDTPLEPAEPAVTRTYAAGVGVVGVADAATGEIALELVAHTP